MKLPEYWDSERVTSCVLLQLLLLDGQTYAGLGDATTAPTMVIGTVANLPPPPMKVALHVPGVDFPVMR